MRNYIIGALLLSSIILFFMWRNYAIQVQRLASNQNVLLDSVNHYITKDSLNAASLGILQIELSELKEFRAKDAQTIRNLGIKLRRVQSISKVFTQSRYTVEIPNHNNQNTWHYSSMWMELNAQRIRDTIHTQITTYDTLVQILHRVPRFKFLGINFGVKGVRQEIISRNPHTKIVAAEYLDIVK